MRLPRYGFSHFVIAIVLLALVARSPSGAFTSAVTGLGMSAVVTLALWSLLPSFTISVEAAAVIAGGFALLTASQLGNPRVVRPSLHWGNYLVPQYVAICQILLHFALPKSAVSILARFGEDNAIFLNNSALLGEFGIVSRVAGNGSSAVAVFQSLQEVLHGTARDLSQTLGVYSFEMLFSAYAFVISCIALMVVHYVVLEVSDSLKQSFVVLLCFTIFAPLFLGLVKYGHFSALVAVCMLISTHLQSRFLDRSSEGMPSIFLLTAFCTTALAASTAWSPLRFALLPAIVLGSSLTLRTWSRTRRLPNNDQKTWLSASLFGIGSILVVGLVLHEHLWLLSSLRNRDLDWLRFQLSLGGGNAMVDGPLVFLVLGLAILGATKLTGSHYPAQAVLVWSTVAVTTALTVLSWSLSPEFQPGYGVQKFQFISICSLVPFIFVAFKDTLSFGPWRKTFAYGYLALAALVAFVNPLQNISVIGGSVKSPFWAKGFEKLISKTDQIPVCLETSPDLDRELAAYTCTRLALGSIGLHQTPLIRLAGGSICWATSESIQDATSEIDQPLGLLLFDASRLTSEDGCMERGWSSNESALDEKWLLGWVSGLPWSTAEFLDLQGRAISPSFDYLTSRGNYTTSEVSTLNNLLEEP